MEKNSIAWSNRDQRNHDSVYDLDMKKVSSTSPGGIYWNMLTTMMGRCHTIYLIGQRLFDNNENENERHLELYESKN